MKKILSKIAGIVTMFAMTFGVALATPPEQITFCHVPPGNPENAQTLTTSVQGWQNGHQNHELDYLGECQGENDNECDGPCEQDVPVCVEGNLVANGGFESPDVAAGNWTIFDDGTASLAWDVQWNGAFVGAPETAKLEIHDSLWTPVAQGSQYAELDADWGINDGEQASVVISQDIATVMGASYELGYDFSPRTGTDASQNMLEVWVNGVNVQDQAADGSSNPGNVWTHYTYEFVATGTSTTIAFKDMGTPDSLGTLLDNVSVNCEEMPPEEEECPAYEQVMARINFSKVANGAQINGWRNWGLQADIAPVVYVGGTNPLPNESAGNVYDSEEWFPLTNPDGSYINDPLFSFDVPGLAVQRYEGKVRVVLFGSHDGIEAGQKEMASGVVEISTTSSFEAGMKSPMNWGPGNANDGWSNDNSNPRLHDAYVNDAVNPMESRLNYNGGIDQYDYRFDRMKTISSNKVSFTLVVTAGNDGFYAHYDTDNCVEEVNPQ